MTIAACYVSAEGVVLGADSTTTMFVLGPGPGPSYSPHQFNCAQKVFEIGRDSTLGMTMWGLGSLGTMSYRTLVARFADALASQGAQSLAEVTDRWNQSFWSAYSSTYGPILQRVQHLLGQASPSANEQAELTLYRSSLSGGFCVGGYLLHDRNPGAFEIRYDPTFMAAAAADPIPIGTTRFWGCPNLMERLIYGIDLATYRSIVQSGHWKGTPQDLAALIEPHRLAQPLDLPIREAIDWVHASIYTTIKTMKFSHLDPVCGGAVEIAVITTDRPFRWVRHKRFDAAIAQGGLLDA